VPIIVVSDSKLHDTYFVRFFLMYKLLGQDGWLYTQTREVGLRGRIKRIFIDSDGASAHFKQRGSIHFITFLCIFFGLLISWTFGCPGHGKGTWDGLGGIVKNKTGDYIRAMDSFLSSAKEVFEVIFDLFASDKARERFHAAPHIKIKEWIILWLSDTDIIRPAKPVVKKVSAEEKAKRGEEKAAKATEKEDLAKMSKEEKKVANANAKRPKNAKDAKIEEDKNAKAQVKALATENGEVLEDEIQDDSNKFSPLKAFHDVGVRGIFSFQALHREGLGLRLSACHCHFCIRGHHNDGFGTMPTGCLGKEPYQYLVC
jgi:hypothetical protein